MINMGIVGTGIWGETHASIYNEHPLARVIAVCDINPARAQAAAQRCGAVEYYTDYREMAKKANIDAVAIVTPDFLHADIAITFAAAGKHLLIEKPLATTRQDVYNMVEAIEKNGVRAMVDFHNRWSPPFNCAKSQISSNTLGEPLSAYFRLNDIKWVATDMLPWASKSSIMWFLGSHSLDTLRWLFHDEPCEVYSVKREGLLKNMGVDTADMYMTTIRFSKGGIAQMENGWITPNANTCINDIKFNMILSDGKIDIDASSHNLIQISTDTQVKTPDILVQNYVFDQCKGFAYESIRSFIDCLYNEKEFHVSLYDAANTSLCILDIFDSAKSGKPVTVSGLFGT